MQTLLFKRGRLMYRFLGIVVFSQLVLSTQAFCAQLISCSSNKLAAIHRCVLEPNPAEQGQIGDSVIVYRTGSYWAGTGTVIRKRGNYLIVEFKDFIGIIHKGLEAHIYKDQDIGITDWRHAFSNSEALPYR